MKQFNLSFTTSRADLTYKVGCELGQILFPGSVIALNGDLGSGKTVFIQGLARGLGIKNLEEVRSPTFSLIQEHQGKIPLCHVDLYRLSFPEVLNLGLEEYWKRWVVAIEWAEKAGKFIPSDALNVQLEFVSKNSRKITFSVDENWKKVLKTFKAVVNSTIKCNREG